MTGFRDRNGAVPGPRDRDDRSVPADGRDCQVRPEGAPPGADGTGRQRGGGVRRQHHRPRHVRVREADGICRAARAGSLHPGDRFRGKVRVGQDRDRSQALEETSLCLDGVSGLMHRLGHASFVGVLTDEPMRKFGQRHLKFCQTIYPFMDVFYPTVKEGGEE